jgi:hypothetical protein
LFFGNIPFLYLLKKGIFFWQYLFLKGIFFWQYLFLKGIYIYMSALSISSNNIKKCSDVAEHLRTVGVMCKVVDNTSIIYNKVTKKYEKEQGCDILLTEPVITQDKIAKVWLPLKDKYELECGYLSILGNYQGCIWDYLRKSHCPRGGAFY